MDVRDSLGGISNGVKGYATDLLIADEEMVSGLGRITLYLLEKPNSLKEKRRVVKSLKDRVRARFNVSICEADDQDLWHRATLGIALVCSDRKQAQSISDKIIEFIREAKKVEIIEHDFVIENH